MQNSPHDYGRPEPESSARSGSTSTIWNISTQILASAESSSSGLSYSKRPQHMYPASAMSGQWFSTTTGMTTLDDHAPFELDGVSEVSIDSVNDSELRYGVGPSPCLG
jgi:hypothetical protein